MKRMLWLLLGWLVVTTSASASGLIIIHEEDFWRRPPPRIVPPEGSRGTMFVDTKGRRISMEDSLADGETISFMVGIAGG